MANKIKQTPSPVGSDEEEEVYEVEKIVSHKDNYDAKQRVTYEFLVRWKNYPPSADTWEPRDSLVDGAESILVDYIRKQNKRGVKIWDDGTKKSRMIEVKEDKPTSRDSSIIHEPSKKKKRDSDVEGLRDEGHEKEPSRKKARKEEIDMRSPTPPPISKTKSKKAATDSAVPPASSGSRKEKLAPTPPIARTANMAELRKGMTTSDEGEDAPEILQEIKAKLPQQTAEQSKEDNTSIPQMGSIIYRDEDTWEHLLKIDTLEQDPAGAAGYRWAVKWNNLEESEWISNAIGRRKFPQRALDFYEDHVKFKIGTEGDEDPEANGTEEA